MWSVEAPQTNTKPQKRGVHFCRKARVEDEVFQWLHIQADANRDGKIQYGEFVRWLFSEGGGQAPRHAVLKVPNLGITPAKQTEVSMRNCGSQFTNLVVCVGGEQSTITQVLLS